MTVLSCELGKSSPRDQKAKPSAEIPFSIESPERLITDIDSNETAAREFSKFVRAQVIDLIAEHRFDELGSAFDEGFRGRWPKKTELETIQTGTIAIAQLDKPGDAMSPTNFIARLGTYFTDSVVMERRAWKMYETRLDAKTPTLLFGRAHLLMAGRTPSGARFQFEAKVVVRARGSGSDWRIHAWDFDEASWSIVQVPIFRNISSVTGFQFRDSPRERKTAQALIDMRRMLLSGLTVFDFDHDGYWDILSTRKGRGATLFRNDGYSGFQAGKILPAFKDADAANFYLAVDLDGDGKEDLVSTHVAKRDKGEAVLAVYRRNKRGFVLDARTFKFEIPNGQRQLDFSTIVTCDVNSDGALDYIVLGYMHAESGGEDFNLVDGHDGLRNLLFINQGKGRFSERGLTWGLNESQYSYVAECYDFDRDGDVDLFVGNDYGRNNFYENLAGQKFEARPQHAFASARGFTMGFSMADIENEGHWSVGLSNMYSHAGNRIVPLVGQLGEEMRTSVLALAGGNNVFEQRREGWEDRGTELGMNYAAWAWGNIFFDYDNDGDKDQYVVNGFTTHSDPEAPDY